MIIVHHLNHSRSQRILWFLEELGVPYQVQRYERDPQTMLAPTALKKIHPLGKSPVIVDGDLTLAESGAIIEYLQEAYDAQGMFMPTDFHARQQYRYWLHYAEGSLMPLLVMKLVFSRLGQPPIPAAAAGGRRDRQGRAARISRQADRAALRLPRTAPEQGQLVCRQ